VPWNKRLDNTRRGMTSWVVRKVVNGEKLKLKLVRVGPKAISEGLVQLKRVQVMCPACGQQVEAIARDGRVKGYCAVAKQSVDFLIEKQRTAETKAEISAGLAPMRAGRDSRGRFVKGNVPLNKRTQSP